MQKLCIFGQRIDMTKHEIILMSITGEDKPGVTSSLTEILSKHNATILDIGQANIHQSLSLGILFRLDPVLVAQLKYTKKLV